MQLAAQVLDDFNDEDIGFGLVDAKKNVAVAKKLGNVFQPDPLNPNTIIPLSIYILSHCSFLSRWILKYNNIKEITLEPLNISKN